MLKIHSLRTVRARWKRRLRVRCKAMGCFPLARCLARATCAGSGLVRLRARIQSVTRSLVRMRRPTRPLGTRPCLAASLCRRYQGCCSTSLARPWCPLLFLRIWWVAATGRASLRGGARRSLMGARTCTRMGPLSTLGKFIRRRAWTLPSWGTSAALTLLPKSPQS